MIITNLKKVRYGYQVTIGDQTHLLEEDTIVKCMLSKGKEVTTKQLNDILKENQKAFYTRKGLLYLKNAHSIHEFKVYLRNLGADDTNVDTITNEFKKRHYLDDTYYAKIMVDRNKQKYGKSKIEHLLISKGIHKDIIETLKMDLDIESLKDKIQKAVSLNKKPNYYQAKNTLLRQFVSKGYELDVVSKLLDEQLKSHTFNPSSTLKKEITKLLKKYAALDDYNQIQKIKQALYQKGYSHQAIIDTLTEMGNNDV
jgi:regulatory protein